MGCCQLKPLYLILPYLTERDIPRARSKKSGEIHYNKDGTYVIVTGIKKGRTIIEINIKVKEEENKIIVELIVIKIHAGHLNDISKF